MKTIRQLIRQPVKTLMGILLIAMAVAILITCIGQYAAAVRMRADIDKSYTTIAVPTPKARQHGSSDDALENNPANAGLSGIVSEYMEINPALGDWLAETAVTHPEIVESVSYSNLFTAYLPKVSPINYTKFYDVVRTTFLPRGVPYVCAMLEVTLTEISRKPDEHVRELWLSLDKPITQTTRVNLTAKGTVEKVIGLQEGFRDPTGCPIQLTFSVFDKKALDALQLEVGKRYLVYGMDYQDLDYDLRCMVSLDQANFEQPFSMDKVLTAPPELQPGDHDSEIIYFDALGTVYNYYRNMIQRENGKRIAYTSFGVEYLATARACSLTVCDYSAIPGVFYDYDEQGAPRGFKISYDTRRYYPDIASVMLERSGIMYEQEIDTETYIAAYGVPTAVQLSGTAEEFLASGEGAIWRRALDEMEINNHALPVLAVERVSYQADFSRGQAQITSGRDFTPNETESGAQVCILSESLALENGLAVGDTVELRTYSYDPNINILMEEWNPYYRLTNFPDAAFYSRSRGFDNTMRRFTVVGLYRQENEWHNGASDYGFTPNTVFVPKSCVSGDGITRRCGIFYSIVLKKGAQEAFDALLTDAGFPGTFVYYDQGYARIMNGLDAYSAVSHKACIAGAAAYAAIMALFFLLYPLGHRKNLTLMSRLGTPRRKRFSHVALSTLTPLCAGSLLGACAGTALWGRVTSGLMASAGVDIVLAVNLPRTAAVLSAAQLLPAALLALLLALLITGGNNLMKRK